MASGKTKYEMSGERGTKIREEFAKDRGWTPSQDEARQGREMGGSMTNIGHSIRDGKAVLRD